MTHLLPTRAQIKKLTILLFAFLFLLSSILPAMAEGPSLDTSPTKESAPPKEESTSGQSVEDVPPEDHTDSSEESNEDTHDDEHEDGGEKGDGGEDSEERAGIVNNTAPTYTVDLTPSTIEKLLPQVDAVTGALVYAYPLTTPPGRNGVQPNLQLTYNNQDADPASSVGYGWSVSIPYIERINKTGTGTLYTGNYFRSSIDGELVNVGNNMYRPLSEGGTFLEYVLTSNTWTVRDKSGTIFTFGSTTASRQDDPNNTSSVYRWMLAETRDRNDNFVSYTYTKQTGQLYPQTISYTGHGTTAGMFSIQFLLGARPDPNTSFKTAFSVTTSQRISGVNVFVNGTLSRAYAFGYSTGSNGARSMLSSFVETGYDASGTPTVLPPTTITYQSNTKSLTAAPSWSVPIAFTRDAGACLNQGGRIADVNGDGVQDLVKSTSDGSNNWDQHVYLGTTSGWVESFAWVLPPVPFANMGCADYGTQLVDINGDSLADIVYARNYSSSSTTDREVYLNTGSGWSLNTSFVMPRGFVLDWSDFGTRMADVNGDGLPDILWSRGPTENGVALNTGSSWVVNPSWVVPGYFVLPSLSIHGQEVADVNGDGLTDIVEANTGSSFTQAVYLNTGTGWGPPSTTFIMPRAFAVNSLRQIGTLLIDMNADGLNDVVYAHQMDTNVPCTQEVYLNTGSSWVLDPSWVLPACFTIGGNGTDLGTRTLDVDNDGVLDFVQSVYDSNTYSILDDVYIGNGIKADLLSRATLPTGGWTQATYLTPQEYQVGPALANTNVPLSFDTVSTLSRNDGLGLVSTDTYTYAGGSYYFASPMDHRFAGFLTVAKTNAVGETQTTWYHQGNSTTSSLGEYDDHVSKIGKPFRIEVANATGNLFAMVVNQWDKTTLGGTSFFVKLASTLHFDYDGNATHRDRATTYVYNNTNGNISSMTEWGEVNGNSNGTFADLGNDKRTTTVSYAANSTYHVLGLPSQETVVNQSGVMMMDTKYYYDGLILGAVNIGNETKVERWKTSTQYVDTEKTYNSFGFVTSALDELNHTTTFTPDAYNLYPASTANTLGHTTSYQYDYSSGKPTQVTIPNGGIVQTTYDGFDRPLEEKQSSSANATTLETKTTYQYLAQSVGWRTKKMDWLDGSISKDAYAYTDGFDRPIQSRVEAETTNTFAVTDTVYDSREYIWKQSLPYFSTGFSRTSATTTPNLLSTFTYDALGRTTNIATAIGSTSTMYDQWSTTVTDPRNVQKNLTKDAYDRLVNIVEYTFFSQIYTTNYTYNPRGDLLQINDALGNVRSFTYDGLSQRLTAQDLHALSDTTFGTWTFTYNNVGSLLTRLDPKAQTVQYTYDVLNRPLTENYTGTAGVEVTNTYDSCTNGLGRLCSVTKTGVSQSQTYDELGRISTQTKTTDSTPYITSFAFDRQGNTTLLTNPDLSQIQYIYNNAGLLNAVNRKESTTSFTSVVSNMDYAPTGKRTITTHANNTTTTNTYNANQLYRLQSKVTTSPSGNLQSLTYTYDPNNNITQITDASNSLSAKTTIYTYDALNRLLSATVTGAANGNNGTQSYAYNAIGNIDSRSDVPGLYEYGGNVGSSYANPHAATTAGGTTYTYDNNGNVATSSALATITTTPTITPSWYAGTPGTWAKRLPLTIQQNQINGTTALANFPVLVSLTNTNLRSTTNGGFVASATGNDLMFTSTDGVTKLSHEIESYNPTTGTLVAWVKIPSLSATVNTAIYLYFGNASSGNQQSATSVWETNYKGVWHLKENPSVTNAVITDSTSNAYGGAPYGSMPASASTAAKIGNGLVFDGVNDNIHLGLASGIGNLINNFTVSVWVRPTILSGIHRIISPRRVSSNNGFAFGTNGTNPRLSTYGVKEYSLTSALSTNTWYRLDVVLSGNNATYYRNGVSLGTVTHTAGGVANTDDNLRIGATSGVGANTVTELFRGTMDELRVYSGTRTANWIQAEYNNQNAPASFVTSSTVQSVPVPVTTTTNVTTTYAWDYNNRLTSISSPSVSASFVYDSEGTRVKSVLGGVTTKTPSTWYNLTGTTPTKHILTPDGEMLATIEGSNASAVPSYIHTDHLTGSAVVTNASGAQIQLLDYFPFGTSRINTQTGTFNEKRKFAGHEYDTETGLSYMLARYYNPASGRFMSQDPAYLAIGDTFQTKQLTTVDLQVLLSDPQMLNSYAYGRNNPLVYRDADGNFAFLIPLAAYAVANASWLVPTAITWIGASTLAISAPLVGGQIASYAQGDQAMGDQFGVANQAVLGIGTAAMGGMMSVDPARQGSGQTNTSATVQRGGVYILKDARNGEVMRSGRTNNLMRRQAEHARFPTTREFKFDAKYKTDNYAEQRGLEQMVHDTYKPTLNKINPINPSNPRLDGYLNSAKTFLKNNGL